MDNPAVVTHLRAAEDNMRHLFSSWLWRTSDNAAIMFKKIDLDANGRIEKDEFISRFPAVCEEVCDTSPLKWTLIRVHSSSAS